MNLSQIDILNVPYHICEGYWAYLYGGVNRANGQIYSKFTPKVPTHLGANRVGQMFTLSISICSSRVSNMGQIYGEGAQLMHSFSHAQLSPPFTHQHFPSIQTPQ